MLKSLRDKNNVFGYFSTYLTLFLEPLVEVIPKYKTQFIPAQKIFIKPYSYKVLKNNIPCVNKLRFLFRNYFNFTEVRFDS